MAAGAVVKKSRTVYSGRVFSVTCDTVIEPGGTAITRDVVRHAGSAVIMPRRDDGRILLVRQFRLPAGRRMWELAAGRLDKGEAPLEAARRELREETGLAAERWTLLAEYYPSPGFVDEKMSLFLAEQLKRGKKAPEPDELIRQRWFPLEDVLRLVHQRKIQDGKTIIGALLLRNRSQFKIKKLKIKN